MPVASVTLVKIEMGPDP